MFPSILVPIAVFFGLAVVAAAMISGGAMKTIEANHRKK